MHTGETTIYFHVLFISMFNPNALGLVCLVVHQDGEHLDCSHCGFHFLSRWCVRQDAECMNSFQIAIPCVPHAFLAPVFKKAVASGECIKNGRFLHFPGTTIGVVQSVN